MHEYGSPEYNRLIPGASRKPGSRAVIVVDVYQVGSVRDRLPTQLILWALIESDTVQTCGYAVPMYDFVTHRTQLLRFYDKVEDVDRSLAASCDQQRSDQAGDATLARDGSAGAGDKASKPQISLRRYWVVENMLSLDGLPGLSTAPDAILGMTPQSNFDKDGPRPMLRRGTEVSNTALGRDHKWFVSGFVLGTVSVLALTILARSLKK